MSLTNPIPRRLSMVVIALLLTSGITVSALAQTEGAGPQEPVQLRTQPMTSRYQPIVNGHNLQPSQSELGKPDISGPDAKITDDLYRKLIKEEEAQYPALFDHPAAK